MIQTLLICGLRSHPYLSDLQCSLRTSPLTSIIYHLRCPVTKPLMQSLSIIELEISTQALYDGHHTVVVFQIYVLVFDCPPQPLDEYVIKYAATPIHADTDPRGFEPTGEILARELHSLVAVKYLWPAYGKGL